MKTCKKCNEEKEDSCYYRSYRLENTLQSSCKKCISLVNKEDFIKLNHYSNLQYLLASDNLKKSNKLDFVLQGDSRVTTNT